MLAYLLCLGLGIELVLYSVGGVLLWHYEKLQPGWAVLLALGIAVGIRAFTVMVMFIYAWVYRAERPTAMRIGLWQTVRLVYSELAAFLVLYCVLQPAQHWLGRYRPVSSNATTAQGLPVLLIHGYCCNAAYWWAMERYLRGQGIGNLFTINLEPVFADINHYAIQVAERVAQIRTLTGADQVILVGHSMGGLVARAYVHWYGGKPYVARIITLGSPHNGSKLLRLSLVKGPNVEQMHPGNLWLTRLNAAETQPSPVPITSIYSVHDNLVALQDRSVLNYDHVKNIPLPGIGHLAMTFSRRLQRLVQQEILEATWFEPGAVYPSSSLKGLPPSQKINYKL